MTYLSDGHRQAQGTASIVGDGRVKEMKRDEAERNAEYNDLVCGTGLMMAAATFAAAPTLATVHIAAYTKREQKGRSKGPIDEDFVYVAVIPRSTLDGLNPKDVKPCLFLMRFARMDSKPICGLRDSPEKTCLHG